MGGGTLVSRRFVRKTSCQHDILSASWLRRFVRKTSCHHDILSGRHFVREFLCDILLKWPALDVLSGYGSKKSKKSKKSKNPNSKKKVKKSKKKVKKTKKSKK